MKVTQSSIDLVKQFEGFEPKAYHGASDRSDVFTIGYGTTVYPANYMNGKKVALNDPEISKSQASAFVGAFLNGVLAKIESAIKVPLNQNQVDALLSFAYNLGVGALLSSTLLKKINVRAPDAEIQVEFAKWVNSNGKPVSGLVKRRKIESEIFFKKV